MSTIDFSLGDLIDESTERAGLNPKTLTADHLTSIARSINLVATDLESLGPVAEYRTDTLTVTLPSLYGAVQLPSDTIDVSGVCILAATGGVRGPVPLARTHREDYQTLSFPSARSPVPSLFWVSKSQPPESMFLTGSLGADYLPSLNFSDPRNSQNLIMFPAWPCGAPLQQNGEGPFLILWPMNSASEGRLTVTRVRQIKTQTEFGEQLDMERAWTETFVRGLAASLARKWNKPEYPGLKMEFQEALDDRRAENDMHPVRIAHRGFGFARPRRH